MTAQEGVRRYYDANTWKFLLAGSERAIHRGLWGPGVGDRAAAVHHAHQLVLDALGPEDRLVLDLGCGVGSAALHLARRRPVDVVGVSISPTQVRLAQRFARKDAARSGPLLGRVRFRVADFTALPDDLVRELVDGPGGVDLAFSIEAFVHADPAAAYLGEAARVLRPGGTLLLVDDVLTSPSADPRLEEFRDGWHVSSLLTVAQAAALAADAGLDLVDSVDLSPYQRLGRPRDRLIALALPGLRRLRARSAYARSLVGGAALQECHRAGLLEYRLLRFVRRSP